MTQLSPGDGQRFLAAALHACRRAGAIEREHFRSSRLAVELKADDSPVTQADRGAEEAIRETLRRATPELGLLGEEFGHEGDRRDRWIIDPLDGTKNFVAGLPFFAVLIGLELDGELQLGVVHAPVLGPGSGLAAVGGHGDAEVELGETWWALRGAGAYAGTGTTPESCRQRRLQVSQVGDLGRAFVTHGGLWLFQERELWPQFTELVARAGRTRGFGDWWGHVLVAEGRCDAMVEARVAVHDVAPIKVLVEEAGGTFLTQQDRPLDATFGHGVISATSALAPELRRVMGY